MKTYPAKAIVTVKPYVPFIDEVIAHPLVSGIRFNTAMEIKEGAHEEVLKYLLEHAGKKDIWIDLKCRQLRIKTHGSPPFTSIELTHRISVDTPVTAYFDSKYGKEPATVLQVDGNRLIMQEGPRRVVGPGESVNIPHPSLHVEGYLTETDTAYIAAAKKLEIHTYMLSFVEGEGDVQQLYELDSQAQAVVKIESLKGVAYVHRRTKERERIMAARGDLYLEVRKPHQILNALEDIIGKDPSAIVASRIAGSFVESSEPSCNDISDIDNLLRMGYRTFMLGDEVCLQRGSVISAYLFSGFISLSSHVTFFKCSEKP